MLVIGSLSLHHFRNYAFAELQTEGRSVILTGPNGAGKTNILEAVSLLLPGRGLRKARLSDLKRQANAQPWVIAADVSGLQGAAHLGTSLDPESDTERRLIKIDGEKAKSQTALAEHLAIAWQTPQMDGLFLASDGERRRYLDRLICSFDPTHLTRVNGYEHAMRERTKLLADARPDAAWLGALEEKMAQTAVSIAAARLELIERLNASISNASGHFTKAEMAMQGDVETLVQSNASSDAELAVQEKLTANRRPDATAGRALFGTHKSLWRVTHSAKQQEAAYCSTGEQKALLLSIMLANARARKDWLGKAPILLLDETVAHLDVTRRGALAQALEALNTQVWLTGTDAADFQVFERFAQHFEVRDAEVIKR
jgi:DNA replication and repair protein RecF